MKLRMMLAALVFSAGVVGAQNAAPAPALAPAPNAVGARPPVVLSAPEPVFSEEARSKKINGNVLVGLEVNETGQPEKVHVVRGTGYGLDEKALEAVKQYRFRPAMKDGQPVRVSITIAVNFQTF